HDDAGGDSVTGTDHHRCNHHIESKLAALARTGSAPERGGIHLMATYTAPGVFVEEIPATAPIVGVGTSTPVFIGIWADGASEPTPAGTVVPILNITKFKAAFGDFTAPPGSGQTLNGGLNTLGHAGKGFFENGGTFCYVARAKVETDIGSVVLPKLEAFDDISMVVAPGVPAATASMTAVNDIITHCKNMGDRIAILDAPANATNPTQL